MRVLHFFFVAIVLWTGSALAEEKAAVLLSDAQIAQVLRHGPWPQKAPRDPSNRASGNADAIALGADLFGDPALSLSGTVSCATCHQPEKAFTDGQSVAVGARTLPRNTLSLFDLPFHRWFGWDGSTDNLWAQSILPILHSEEMKQTEEGVKAVLSQQRYRDRYQALFGPITPQPAFDVTVNTAKALAAYQETLASGRTSFDRFRDSLEAGDTVAVADYPADAQRGLEIFIGRGNCSFCHTGPLFTNGEFHDAGVGYFLADGGVDEGRHRGLRQLLASSTTLDSAYSDDAEKSGAWAVRRVEPKHADFGTFRVPGLRNVAKTSPYMHDGSLLTLRDVVEHYSHIDMERLHADGEALLRPLDLTEQEVLDLVAFLETLNSE